MAEPTLPVPTEAQSALGRELYTRLARVTQSYQERSQCSIQTASERLGGGEASVAPTSAIPCVATPHFDSIGHKIPDTLSVIRSPQTFQLQSLSVAKEGRCGSVKLQLRRVAGRRDQRKSCTDVREQHTVLLWALRPMRRCRPSHKHTGQELAQGLCAQNLHPDRRLGGEVQRDWFAEGTPVAREELAP